MCGIALKAHHFLQEMAAKSDVLFGVALCHYNALLSECKMCVCKKTLDFFHKTCYNNHAVFENDFYIF